MTRWSDRAYQEEMQPRKARPLRTVAAALLVAVVTFGVPRLISGWTSIGREQTIAISGFARIEGGDGALDLLVVHDNKLPGEDRLAILRVGGEPAYTPVAWPGGFALPIDLEGVSPIPGRRGLFLALTSGGTASLLALRDRQVELRGAFTVPERPGLPSFEGLSVQRLGDALVAAWGHRGAGEEAGRLYWGRLELDEAPAVSAVQAMDLRVPYPMELNPNTRHISDMRIARDGRLWIAAANDPGDAGPFQSAIYDAGQFEVRGGVIRFERRRALTPVETYSRKIEAIELTEDESSLVLGTDDEHAGGAVTLLRLVGR